MKFKVKQAERSKIYVKIALMGSSGAGKTKSALRLADGMLQELKEKGIECGNGKVLLANTEASRGYYYSDSHKYDIADLNSPYTPELFIELIDFAVEAGYPVLIIDSASAEWIGRGGCLEIHQKAGGTFNSWGVVTPRHNAFLLKIADSRIHIILCLRAKDQYELEKSDTGKTTIKKIGLGAEMRQGIEYEVTSSFMIDQLDHFSVAFKDNTDLFERDGRVLLTEEHGKKLMGWANSGKAEYVPPSRSFVVEPADLRKQAIALIVELGGKDNAELMSLVESVEKSRNPNKIKDDAKVQELIDKLTEFKSKQTPA